MRFKNIKNNQFFFNSDSFEIYRMDPSGSIRQSAVSFTTNGVLWDVDHTRKFKNPPGFDQDPCKAFEVSAFLFSKTLAS